MRVVVSHTLIEPPFRSLRFAGDPGGATTGFDAREGIIDGVSYSSGIGLSGKSHRLREIHRTDEHDVDTIDRRDRLDVRKRVLMFDLNANQRVAIRGLRLDIDARHRAISRRARTDGQSAIALRMVFRGPHDRTRLIGVHHVRAL